MEGREFLSVYKDVLRARENSLTNRSGKELAFLRALLVEWITVIDDIISDKVN